jgi:hypothetical protein
MPPPGENANGRSLGGRKQIQSSPQSHTNIYFAQARRGLDVHWRIRATRQEDEQLQLDLPREEQTLFGFLEEISPTPKKRDRDATSSILQPSNSSYIKL